MKSLLLRFKDFLKETDYALHDSYTAQKLKSKLVKHYGNAIRITDEQNNIQSVYSSDVSMGDAINCVVKYKETLKNCEVNSTTDNV